MRRQQGDAQCRTDVLSCPSRSRCPPPFQRRRSQRPLRKIPAPGGSVHAAAYSETVRQVQLQLNAKGYSAGPADGYIGAMTRSDIRSYQRNNGLAVDGEASDALLAHMRDEQPQRASSQDDARQERIVGRTQRRLKTLGYYVEETGKLDRRTVNAIRADEYDQRLPITGQLTRELARHIREEARARGVEEDRRAPQPDPTVARIERGLEARGYATGAVDSIADARTEAAIRAYQRDRGVAVTGEPSEKLAAMLEEGMQQDLNTRENIRTVQAELNARGYSAGPADGVMGPSTRRAIVAYRKANGLGTSDDVTQDLLTSLEQKPAGGETKPEPEPARPETSYKVVMSDAFRDGDLTNGPVWSVYAGRFVVQNNELVNVDIAPSTGGQNIFTGILGQALGVKQQATGAAAAIVEGTDMDNAFRVRTTLRAAPDQIVQMHFGPYIGRDIASGYRLIYDKAANHRLALVARAAGGDRVVVEKTGVASISDGGRHAIEVARDKDGWMTVMVDKEVVLEAQDASIGGNFNGYSFIVIRGAWAVNLVSTASAR